MLLIHIRFRAFLLPPADVLQSMWLPPPIPHELEVLVFPQPVIMTLNLPTEWLDFSLSSTQQTLLFIRILCMRRYLQLFLRYIILIHKYTIYTLNCFFKRCTLELCYSDAVFSNRFTVIFCKYFMYYQNFWWRRKWLNLLDPSSVVAKFCRFSFLKEVICCKSNEFEIYQEPSMCFQGFGHYLKQGYKSEMHWSSPGTQTSVCAFAWILYPSHCTWGFDSLQLYSLQFCVC